MKKLARRPVSQLSTDQQPTCFCGRFRSCRRNSILGKQYCGIGFVEEADAFVYEEVSPDSLLEKLQGSIVDENKGWQKSVFDPTAS